MNRTKAVNARIRPRKSRVRANSLSRALFGAAQLRNRQLDKTGNIVLVGKMLGHRSVTTTQRHLHPELKDIANLVNERNQTNRDAVLRHSLRHTSASVQ